jgi:hypothetical protein
MQKNVHGFDGGCDPRLAGQADREHETRLESARVTAEWRAPISTTATQTPWDELPLFGGVHQASLFDEGDLEYR